MPATRKQIVRDKIAEAKHLYENTPVPVDDIAAMLGISRRTLSNRVNEWGWRKRKTGAQDVMRVRRGAADGRQVVVSEALPHKGGGEHPQAPQDRIALAERIQAVAEREIAAVEQILRVLGAPEPAETEAAARTLASLARTLRELVHLETLPPTSEPVDDELPRDLDELRRALAHRLDRLVAEAKAIPPDAGEEH
jgi:DNA-binding Lrp family transcriptional regulator